MPFIPAFCDACGLVFNAPISLGEGVHDIDLGDFFFTCPRCRSIGRIPDGIYSTLGQTVQIIATSERSIKDFQRLVDALKQAQERNASPEEVKAVINEHAPELKTIADILPHTRSELYAVIQAICAVITIFIAVGVYFSRQGISKEQVDEMINKAFLDRENAAEPARSPEKESHTMRPAEPPSTTPPSNTKRKRKASKARARRRGVR